MKARDLFTAIRTEGGRLPADLPQRIVHGDKELSGLDDASYHLVAGERLNERISQSWNRLLGTVSPSNGLIPTKCWQRKPALCTLTMRRASSHYSFRHSGITKWCMG